MKKTNKLFVVMMLLCMLSGLSSIGAFAAVINGEKTVTTSKGIYVYNAAGNVITGSGNRIAKVGNDLYFIDKTGKALTRQWFTLGGSLYLAKANGKLYKNETRGKITFGANGAAVKNTAAKLKIKTMSIVNKVAGKKKTKAAKLKAVWKWMTSKKNFKYTGAKINVNADDWYIKCALEFLNKGRGDCRSFACGFAALASEIGYVPTLEYGYAHFPNKSKYYRHCWLTIKGKYYDPSRALRGILGKDFKYGYAMKSYKLIKKKAMIGKWKFTIA